MVESKQTSIDIALNMLELFSAEKREVGLTEMAVLLGKKVSTIHRTVKVLKNRGYIEQALQCGKYRLGSEGPSSLAAYIRIRAM